MISIKNLTKSTSEKELFRDLSFTLNSGDRLGIIGENGCGKSTLFRILLGTEQADEGAIDRAQEKILLAPQHIDASEHATLDSYLNPTENPEVWRLLSELNLIDIPLDTPIAQLSGGQKTKLLLVKTFSTPSTTLLLDEPTNHLDTITRTWLLKEIHGYPGIIVLISHDRTFLNACTTRILEIDPANKQTMFFEGNYDTYKKEKAAWKERQTSDYSTQQKQKREMEAWIVLKRQEATAHPSPAKGRQLRQMERRLEREILSKEIIKPRTGKEIMHKSFIGDVHTGKIIFRLKEVTKSYQETQILKGVTCELRGKVHARLTGENGSGKSTLLKILAGKISPDTGTVEIGENVHINYFAQQLESLNENASVFETFTSIPHHPLSESRARALLGAFLFSGDSIQKKIRNLSYGERVRLQLAILLQQDSELLILDEPTNHLDIPSREIIEEALRNYQGALLVVSHDEYFLKNIGIDIELILGEGKLKEKHR